MSGSTITKTTNDFVEKSVDCTKHIVNVDAKLTQQRIEELCNKLVESLTPWYNKVIESPALLKSYYEKISPRVIQFCKDHRTEIAAAAAVVAMVYTHNYFSPICGILGFAYHGFESFPDARKITKELIVDVGTIGALISLVAPFPYYFVGSALVGLGSYAAGSWAHTLFHQYISDRSSDKAPIAAINAPVEQNTNSNNSTVTVEKD